MRFALLLVVATVVAGSFGCSSDDDAKPGPVDRKHVCVAAGGVCAGNIPYTCRPGFEAATDPDRKDSCGKSVDAVPVDVPCCLPLPEEDTGPRDTGTIDADAMSDAPSESGADASPDASETGGDALLDVSLDVSVDGG